MTPYEIGKNGHITRSDVFALGVTFYELWSGERFVLRIAHKPGPAKLSLTVPKLHSGYRLARPGTRTTAAHSKGHLASVTL